MNIEQITDQISIKTHSQGFIDITNIINKWIKSKTLIKGIINLTLLHTSASLTINENADPRVLKDLNNYMKAIVPEDGFTSINNTSNLQRYSHADEGPDDMPAHIRTSLTTSSISLSIEESSLTLGVWQALYLWEHRQKGSERRIAIHFIGDKQRFVQTTSEVIDYKENSNELNKIVISNHDPNAWAKDEGIDTNIDLMIDRIHDLAGEDTI